MAFRTYDYHCECGHEEKDFLIEEGEEPECPKCGLKLIREIPLSNVVFGNGYFAGTWPRRVETIHTMADGSTRYENITHKVNVTDTSGEK